MLYKTQQKHWCMGLEDMSGHDFKHLKEVLKTYSKLFNKHLRWSDCTLTVIKAHFSARLCDAFGS